MLDNPASWIWVLIPLAAIGIAPFKMWLRMKEKQIEAQSSLAAEKTAQYAAHVERIEARLRVLEQIVTDRGVDTAAQIEALRQGELTIIEDGTRRRFGQRTAECDLATTIHVTHPQFWANVAFGGTLGAGESFINDHFGSIRPDQV